VTTLGKTLLVMGDSVMEQFYNTLQCLAAKESLKVRDRGRYGEIRPPSLEAMIECACSKRPPLCHTGGQPASPPSSLKVRDMGRYGEIWEVCHTGGRPLPLLTHGAPLDPISY